MEMNKPLHSVKNLERRLWLAGPGGRIHGRRL